MIAWLLALFLLYAAVAVGACLAAYRIRLRHRRAQLARHDADTLNEAQRIMASFQRAR